MSTELQGAQLDAAAAAIHRIDELAEEWPDHLPLIDALRAQYEHRATHLGEYTTSDETTAAEQELIEHQKIRQSVIAARPTALLGLAENQGRSTARRGSRSSGIWTSRSSDGGVASGSGNVGRISRRVTGHTRLCQPP